MRKFGIRIYRSERRAEVYAKALAQKNPTIRFEVAPQTSWAIGVFGYVIRATHADGRSAIVGY